MEHREYTRDAWAASAFRKGWNMDSNFEKAYCGTDVIWRYHRHREILLKYCPLLRSNFLNTVYKYGCVCVYVSIYVNVCMCNVEEESRNVVIIPAGFELHMCCKTYSFVNQQFLAAYIGTLRFSCYYNRLMTCRRGSHFTWYSITWKFATARPRPTEPNVSKWWWWTTEWWMKSIYYKNRL